LYQICKNFIHFSLQGGLDMALVLYQNLE